MQQGSLICVGTGIMLGAHLDPLSRNYIEQADVVFMLMADAMTEQWLLQMHPDVRSLQPFYHQAPSRQHSYQLMVEAMLAEVAAGKKVVGAFYGHPAVFALVPHEAVRQARELGYYSKMLPGISAEDCLYADLGIDPGRYGCQLYECSQFMFYQRTIDTAAYLVLWQLGIAGDRSLARFSTPDQYRQLLTDYLCQFYPAEHLITLYEAASLPTEQPRIDSMPLNALASAAVTGKTTLVIPPASKLQPNTAMLAQLAALDAQSDAQSDVKPD
ncbi:SAM-dependent methyltransferase [Arsukibacterium sp.]|uniref:SAM-dependent methyltransferase n=1 Tax=Arsukibacterium sp. TaxID=1977258 RepID=UPI002FDB4942